MKNEEQLQLLICSANLGNAQPDEKSLNCWVPENGNCQQVFMNEQYPVRKRIDYDDSELQVAHDYQDYSEQDQFDIIVFGLQESTFDPPPNPKLKEQVNDIAAAIDGNNILNNNLLDQGNKFVAKKTATAIQKVTAGGNKAKSAMETLTANRDHTKRDSNAGGNKNMYTLSPQLSQQPQWLGGTHVLHDMLAKRLPSYERVVSFQRGEMRLILLVRSDAVDVDVVHVSAQNTGRAGLANKGGIVTEILVNGYTRLSFFTAHLEAHEGAEKYKQRVSSISDIFAGTKEKQHDCSLTAHYSFAMGDLNFRTELPNYKELEGGEEEHKQIVRQMVKEEDWDSLNKADELHRALRQGECFAGFTTLFCNFPPTFKVERREGYHYIDKRRPSYTDRILWKANHELGDNVNPLIYEPIDDFASSDHKPIRAAFTVDLNQPFCLRPKMTRRRSVMNLRSILHKKKGKHEVAHKERLHLFLSDMSCSIHREGSKGNEPNPYVCLVSNPPDTVQQTVMKRWRRLSQFLRLGPRHGETNFVTPKGWPRSSIKKQTYVANWHEEEIHAEVRTHGEDGAPIDLTGALLLVTVIDSRASSDDVVLGTYSFNLVNLIRKCRPSTQESSKRVLKKREAKKQSASRGVSESLQHAPKRRQSILTIFSRGQDAVDENEGSDDDDDPITTVEIDEPLLKNGVEKGHIRFVIESWWMDENTTKALSVGSPIPTNKHSSSRSHNRMGSGAVIGTTADGRQMMLAARHVDGRKKRTSRFSSKTV